MSTVRGRQQALRERPAAADRSAFVAPVDQEEAFLAWARGRARSHATPRRPAGRTRSPALGTRHPEVPGLLGPLAASFRRHLEAEGKRPQTTLTYLKGVASLARYLLARGMPQAPEAISREHLEEWQRDGLRRLSAATVSRDHRSLQAFFRWLQEEDEIRESPLAHLRPPAIPETPPPVLSEVELAALLRACHGRDFAAVRDHAILRLFIDTGARLGELAELTLDALDLDERLVRVRGKGGRERHLHLGRKAARDLDRYLRARLGHPWGRCVRALTRPAGAAHGEWCLSGGAEARAAGRAGTRASPPAPAQLRPPLAARRRRRDRSDASRGLALAADAAAIRGIRRRRAGVAGARAALAWGPDLMETVIVVPAGAGVGTLAVRTVSDRAQLAVDASPVSRDEREVMRWAAVLREWLATAPQEIFDAAWDEACRAPAEPAAMLSERIHEALSDVYQLAWTQAAYAVHARRVVAGTASAAHWPDAPPKRGRPREYAARAEWLWLRVGLRWTPLEIARHCSVSVDRVRESNRQLARLMGIELPRNRFWTRRAGEK